MKIKVRISVKASHERFPHYVRETFGEAELLEWAKNYVTDNYADGNEAIAIDVESIVPYS